MTKTYIVAFLCFSTALRAQVTLEGRIVNLSPSAIQVAMVEYWQVDHWQQLGILQLDGGAFRQQLNPAVQAQCRIRLAGQNKSWQDFIISPAAKGDTLLQFELDARRMDGGPAQVKGSAENESYFQLMSAYRQWQSLRDSNSTATPLQIDEAAQKLNQLCREIAAARRGTFCADIVAKLLYQPRRADYPAAASMRDTAFAQAHALDNIVFQYEGNLYHNAFMKALNQYYQLFDHRQPSGSQQCIDALMSRRNGNQAIDLFLFKYLLDKALEFKNEGAMAHLLTWYPPDCSDESPLPDATKTLIEALKSCTPGQPAPELQLPGLLDKPVSLDAVCRQHKITLLMFWKSNCSHCREFEPALETIYEKYHAQGLEVYAMSLDKLDSGWKSFLESHPTPWVNVYIPQSQRKEINRQFPVPSTPTVIALDRQRKVISRLVLRDQLEAFLQETLPKQANK